MKLTIVTAMLCTALFAGCLSAPDGGATEAEATADEASESGSPAFFTVSPNGPQSGTRYRGSQRGPSGPGTCAGDIPIQRVFTFDSESRRYVEIHFTACVANMRGGLRPNGLAFDLYLD